MWKLLVLYNDVFYLSQKKILTQSLKCFIIAYQSIGNQKNIVHKVVLLHTLFLISQLLKKRITKHINK